MKYVPRMPIPWDMVVFLTITSTGFGLSIQKVLTVPKAASSQNREISAALSGARNESTTELGCLDRSLPNRKILSDAGTIRLKGRFCHLSRAASKAFGGVEVRNITNGYEGTVFFQGNDASFVTDYVLLQPGKNEIELAWKEKDPKVTRKILAEVIEDSRSSQEGRY
jgi:hypothetical protein